MNILYEDTALVVLDKPAGLSSEEGVPAALRQRWGRPDAYVGRHPPAGHRRVGADGLCQEPRRAAAALSTTGDAEPAGLCRYRMAGPSLAPVHRHAPPFVKQYRALIAGRPDETLPRRRRPAGLLVQGQPERPGLSGRAARARACGRLCWNTAFRAVRPGRQHLSLAEITLHTGRTHQIRVQFASRKPPALRRRQIWQPVQVETLRLQSAGLQLRPSRRRGRRWRFNWRNRSKRRGT